MTKAEYERLKTKWEEDLKAAGVRVPTGRILEDERAFGDIDFGWGAWVGRLATGHFDFTCRQISLWADGIQILDKGHYVEPTLATLCREMGVAGH